MPKKLPLQTAPPSSPYSTELQVGLAQLLDGLDEEGRMKVLFPAGEGLRPALGPPGAISPGVKRQGRENHHTHSSNAEVKNARSVHGVVLN
jgi:hypothetical protein